MSNKWLRRKSVAERYEVDERTVDRMKEDGRLPKPMYRGRFPLWNEKELDARDRAAALKVHYLNLKGRSGWSAFLSSDGSLHRWAKSTSSNRDRCHPCKARRDTTT